MDAIRDGALGVEEFPQLRPASSLPIALQTQTDPRHKASNYDPKDAIPENNIDPVRRGRLDMEVRMPQISTLEAFAEVQRRGIRLSLHVQSRCAWTHFPAWSPAAWCEVQWLPLYPPSEHGPAARFGGPFAVLSLAKHSDYDATSRRQLRLLSCPSVLLPGRLRRTQSRRDGDPDRSAGRPPAPLPQFTANTLHYPANSHYWR